MDVDKHNFEEIFIEFDEILNSEDCEFISMDLEISGVIVDTQN